MHIMITIENRPVGACRGFLILEYSECIYLAINKYWNSIQVVLFQELHLDRTRTSVILIRTSLLVEVQKRRLKYKHDAHVCKL